MQMTGQRTEGVETIPPLPRPGRRGMPKVGPKKVSEMNKSSEGLVEEAVSMVERLGELLKGILGVKKEEVPAGAAEIIEESEAPVAEAPMKDETVESNGQAKASKSDLVREFLKKHGTEVRNKDVVEAIKRETGVEVTASLVSILRGKESEKKKGPQARKDTKVSTSRVVSGSAVIREYLEQHGLDSSNEEVVKHVKKTKGLDVRPTLVSSVRAHLKRRGIKTSRIKKFVGKKPKAGRGPTMPAAVIETLKRAGKEGLELSEVAQRVMKSGYEYKGNKDIHGFTQNVYQALHNLSKRIAHPGFKGNTPVVIHEKTPGHRVGRYKLNPKAKVA